MVSVAAHAVKIVGCNGVLVAEADEEKARRAGNASPVVPGVSPGVEGSLPLLEPDPAVVRLVAGAPDDRQVIETQRVPADKTEPAGPHLPELSVEPYAVLPGEVARARSHDRVSPGLEARVHQSSDRRAGPDIEEAKPVEESMNRNAQHVSRQQQHLAGGKMNCLEPAAFGELPGDLGAAAPAPYEKDS